MEKKNNNLIINKVELASHLENLVGSNTTLYNIIHGIHSCGGTCYIVGGYIRDLLLGLDPKDVDVEVHNLGYDETYEIISQYTKASKVEKFGIIITAIDIDFALPRIEMKTGNKYHDFEIAIQADCGELISARRRDFTVNSLMYNLKNDELIDNFNGIHDLSNMKLRHITDSFQEDSIRILRGIRFASTHGFTIDAKTQTAMLEMALELKYQPQKRIEDELIAIVYGQNYSQIYLFLYEVLSVGYGFNYTDSSITLSPLINLYKFLKVNDNWQEHHLWFDATNINASLNNIDKHLQEIENFDNLTTFERVQLISDTFNFRDVYQYLNVKLAAEYSLFSSLKKQYNGYYFLEKGNKPEQIKKLQLIKIGEEFAKLSNYN